jgi:hypothetical protein
MSNITEINNKLINAATASFVTASNVSGIVDSASVALTASFAPNYVLTSVTSSMLQPYVLTSQTSSMTAGTASLALRASGSLTGSLLGTASYVSGSVFTGANPALSASYALTASYTLNGGNGGGGGTDLGLVYAISIGYIMP